MYKTPSELRQGDACTSSGMVNGNFCLREKYKMTTGEPPTLPTLTEEQVPSFQSGAGIMSMAPYCQPFVVLSSQRVEAAIVGVGQEGRSAFTTCAGEETKGNRKDKDNVSPFVKRRAQRLNARGSAQ